MRDPSDLQAASFGVVLIERGAEDGASPVRFLFGVEAKRERRWETDGDLFISVRGGRRFLVDDRRDGSPYPGGWVSRLPELDWRESLLGERDIAEAEMRHALSLVTCHPKRRSPSDLPPQANPIAGLW